MRFIAIAAAAFIATAVAQGPPLRGGAGWVFPPPAIPDGCDSACQAAIIDSLQVRFGDSISVPYLHATDSAKTPILNIGGARFFLSDSPDFVTFSGNMIFDGGVGFFGKFPTVFVPCALPSATPPNPVTQAQARAAYDLALQNCLDESGVNLVNTP